MREKICKCELKFCINFFGDIKYEQMFHCLKGSEEDSVKVLLADYLKGRNGTATVKSISLKIGKNVFQLPDFYPQEEGNNGIK
ncbi:MAG: hypothetical protein V1891_02225 [bacterium]